MQSTSERKLTSLANTSLKRLQQELRTMATNPPSFCSAGLKGSDLYHWTAMVMGPPASPYEGGIFKLSLKFSKKYPFCPPKVYFTTRIYHCNIDDHGGICLDILNNKWSPAITVPSLLLSILSLLTDANPKSPLRLPIAILYQKNRSEHDRLAREWTSRYAMPRDR